MVERDSIGATTASIPSLRCCLRKWAVSQIDLLTSKALGTTRAVTVRGAAFTAEPRIARAQTRRVSLSESHHLQTARNAGKHAYASYSHFALGALETDDGAVTVGSNVGECDLWPIDVCRARSAVQGALRWPATFFAHRDRRRPERADESVRRVSPTVVGVCGGSRGDSGKSRAGDSTLPFA